MDEQTIFTIVLASIVSGLIGYALGHNAATKLWKKTCNAISRSWRQAYMDLTSDYKNYIRQNDDV